MYLYKEEANAIEKQMTKTNGCTDRKGGELSQARSYSK